MRGSGGASGAAVSDGTLLRDVELDGARRCDVRIAGGRIARIGNGLEPEPGEAIHDARGGVLLAGLHDHHIHLLALAAARHSVRCGPPGTSDDAALASALANAPASGGWIRGVGYHESVAGPLDRDRLDRLRGDLPVRVQHRSGALWVLNSAALARLGVEPRADAVPSRPSPLPAGLERDASGRATGRLYRGDEWLRVAIEAGAPRGEAEDAVRDALVQVGARLARLGVVGVSDATPGTDARALALLGAARAAGGLPQHVVVMGDLGPGTEPRAETDGFTRGPRKIVLDERALPELDVLIGQVSAAHDAGRAVAVHCVTRVELVLALVAIRSAGADPGDRIEHAAVAPPDAVALAAELGVAVVTQPHFVAERGDAYLREVDPGDQRWLYRCAGFLAARVPVGGGTDAPFGSEDPWAAMRAAVDRKTAAGVSLGKDEALDPERALALFTTAWSAPGGAPRRIEAGAPADLCLLGVPWARARERLSADDVAATWCGGVCVTGAQS